MPTKQIAETGSTQTQIETLPTKHKAPAKIKVWISSMRGRTAEVEVDQGITVDQFKTMEGLGRSEVRVNNTAVPGRTELKEGDIVVAIPASIVGGFVSI